LHGIGTADAQDIVRHERSVDQGIAFLDIVARVDAQMFAVRYRVLLFHPDRPGLFVDGLDDDDALALLLFTKPDLAGDFRHDGRFAWPACLEDFRHARQTAGDVLRSSDFTRRLG